MEHFFPYDSQEYHMILMQLDDEPASMVNQSAFVKYIPQPIEGFIAESSNILYGDYRTLKTGNLNKRMLEFLKESWKGEASNERVGIEKERVYKHMINERMRRDKQKQNYIALHKLLPLGTKGDKNSIIETTGMRIKELERYKEELRVRNHELDMILGGKLDSEKAAAKIKVRVANPASGIDSMLELLKCLRTTSSTVTSIQSRFSVQELSAQLEIQTKIGATEVEKAVNRSLWEAEKKFRGPFATIGKGS